MKMLMLTLGAIILTLTKLSPALSASSLRKSFVKLDLNRVCVSLIFYAANELLVQKDEPWSFSHDSEGSVKCLRLR